MDKPDSLQISLQIALTSPHSFSRQMWDGDRRVQGADTSGRAADGGEVVAVDDDDVDGRCFCG